MELSSLVSTDRKRVIGELTRGRDMADQLREILREYRNSESGVAWGLLEKVVLSFTQSLSMLNALRDSEDRVSQLITEAIHSPARKPEDSGESSKTPAPKDRRGCYKRRKNLETWAIESSTLCEDGHAWRKYGQKVILNAKHPRNYFRCTHKFDQKCQATKYVQKVEEDPPLYRTTYHGRHTCKNLLKSPHHIIVEAANGPSVMWSFQSGQPTNSSSTSTVINPTPLPDVKHKLEYTTTTTSTSNYYAGPHGHNQFGTISSSQTTSSSHSLDHGDDYSNFDHRQFVAEALHYISSNNKNNTTGGSGSDYNYVEEEEEDDNGMADVYSCTASTHSPSCQQDMDNLMGAFGFCT